ncbi:MAG: 4Fe-4S binding protein [Sulfurospirillum sp.]
MKPEYLFLTDIKLEYPLDESIKILEKADDTNYIVANSESCDTQIYAPEINFYVQNSANNIADKIKNIKSLYDIRSLVFDLSKDMDFEKEVNNKLLIVTDDEENDKYKKILQSDKFNSITLNPSMIVDVNGHIGELAVTIKKDDKLHEIACAQIIWEGAPEFAMKQSGVFDPFELGFDEVIKKTEENLGTYRYKNFTIYDQNICQYHERREEICGKCAEVCPTVAILKDDENKHLEFSQIDCHGCGGCISVCPSGALDYTQLPRSAFSEIKEFYRDKVALIIPRKMNLEALYVELPEDVLPLAIEGEKFLHEAHYLSLLQTSGKSVIFYSDFLSKGSGDAIALINEIFRRKYNKQAIFIAKDKEELEQALKKTESFSEAKYGINEMDLRKREIFSARLSHLVGDDDLGVVKTGEHIHYGTITINEETCTLCMSCVGACNVRALTVHPEDNTLRFNPSICTNCGYCEPTCPEKDCLNVIYDELSLNPEYFRQNIMAKDEIFKCVECGVEFAPKKAIMAIAAKMEPLFGDDEAKIRTLYCCESCKPKVMLKAQLKGKI